jgi:flagellar biosynthesis component FlhA
MSKTYCVVFFALLVIVLCLVFGGVQNILCCVFCFACHRFCFACHRSKNTTQYILDTTKHKTQDDDKQNKNDDKQNKNDDKQNKKHNTICIGQNQTQDTRRRQAKQKTQHNMCWTPPYTRPNLC